MQTNLKDRSRRGEFRDRSPYIDAAGVVRVGGRVKKALVSYDNKHPVLVPGDHWISRLIVRHIHQCGRAGVAATVGKLLACEQALLRVAGQESLLAGYRQNEKEILDNSSSRLGEDSEVQMCGMSES